MSKRERKHKSDQQLSLWSLSMPFLFMALANFAASIINTLVLALVPNNGIIYSEAVGVASKIFNIFVTLSIFIVSGIGVVVSQRIGKNDDPKKIEQAIYTSISVSTILSLGITTISEIISPFILYAFLNPDSQQYDQALVYVEVITLTIILMIPKNAIGAIVNSYGYVKDTIIWNIVGIVIDVSFTFLFVLGIDMGVLGSAMGTIIANLVTFIYALIIFNMKVSKFHIKNLSLNSVVVKQLFKTSLPIGFEKISYNFAMLVVGIFVAQMGLKIPTFMVKDGTSQINLLNLTNTIIETFSNLITITSIAFSNGAIIICSRKMGAKDYDHVKKIIKKAFLISIVADMSLAIVFFFLQPYLIDFFKITQSANIQIYFNNLIRKIAFIPFLLLIFLQLGRTANIIYLTGPTAYGNLFYNSLFAIINTWLIVIIFGFTSLLTVNDQWLTMMYGMNGIFMLKALDEITRGIFNFSWWKSGKWNRDHKIKNPEEQLIENSSK